MRLQHAGRRRGSREGVGHAPAPRPARRGRPATASGVSVCSSSSGCPASTGSPGVDQQQHAGRGLHGVLLAGPARAQPPGRHADGQRVAAASARRRGRPTTGSTWRGGPAARRPGRRPARRSSAPTPGTPRRRRAPRAGSTPVSPASASISRASATVSSTTSAGPPPRSTSTDSATSSALPTARPSGTDMSVSSAVVAQPVVARRCAPSSRPARGRARRVFMNAPEPTLTSSTSPPVPSAIFLLMIELAISGIDSTVPVTSRSA